MTLSGGGRAPTAAPPGVLLGSGPLIEVYDVALLDLDGVVYVGSQPVPAVPAVLAEVAKTSMRLAYVTNNASRRPGEVADLLSGMGITVDVDDVVTSGQAAAHLLRERLAPGSAVLVVGSEALADEVRSVGLVPVRDASALPAAVVQGYGPGVGYAELAEATVAIRGGALWVASNTDSTLPSPRGPLPGNGALVAALQVATGQQPEVVGKPQPGLLVESVQRTGAARPLVVGDRLDTDIEGAVAIGADSMLVLSGVTTPAQLLSAQAGRRPTYIASDVSGLLVEHPPVVCDAERAECNGFVAFWDGPCLVLSGAGDEPLDALRALCGASWRVDKPPVAVRGRDAGAAAVLETFALASARD